MIRMLVSSFYNTLINEEDAISYESMIEIDRIRKKSLFVLLTNRNYKDILYYNKDYPFIDYIISLNGSIIYDVKTKRKIINKKLSKTKIKIIEELFKKNKKFYYTDENVYEENPNSDIYKIEVEITKKDLDTINSISIHKTILEINKKKYLEITENSVYEAIQYLLKMNKISNNEICTIIGNESELEILENIDNTFITKRCAKNLKKITNKKYKQRKIEDILKSI